MRHFTATTIALALTALTLFSFRGNPVPAIQEEEVPGTITAIGNAGSDNVFTFEKWKWTEFSIEEDKVENIHLKALIDCRSLTCDWKDLEKSIRKKPDYFNVSDFPTATVEVQGAEPAEEAGLWTTEALVTIKEITKPIALSFKVSDQKPYQVIGDGVIKRKKFDFNGGGPKNEVPVHFEAHLPEGPLAAEAE